MARRGWSAANYLLYNAALVTTTPLTMACWAKTSITGAFQTLMYLSNSANAVNDNTHYLTLNSSDGIRARTGDAGTVTNAETVAAISANTWFHAAGVWASATSRSAYLNGGNKVTDTASKTPSGLNRLGIGAATASSITNPFAPAGTGDIAEAAIWSAALGDDEIATLALGASPLMIRPQSLVGYWPLLGNNSPENNFISNTSRMSITGSLSASAHPRLILPHRRRHA